MKAGRSEFRITGSRRKPHRSIPLTRIVLTRAPASTRLPVLAGRDPAVMDRIRQCDGQYAGGSDRVGRDDEQAISHDFV